MRAPLRSLGWSLLALLGLVACVGVAPWCAWQARREAQWPVVEGVLREASVEYVLRKRSFLPWEVALRYEYRAGGKRYTGRQWASQHGLRCWTRSGAEERARDFVPGASVLVHHDPDDPEQAVLELGSAQDAWISLGGGLFFLAVGVARWRRIQRESSRSRP